MDTNALAELKNIHLPKPISIFPLAIGWYILSALIICVICLLIWWQLKKRKQQKYINNIYQLLDKIEVKSRGATTSDIIAEVSILMKRVAITKFSEKYPHTLFGEKWLQFLDVTGKTRDFTCGAGKNLLNIYQKHGIDNHDEFFAVIKQWLRTVL